MHQDSRVLLCESSRCFKSCPGIVSLLQVKIQCATAVVAARLENLPKLAPCGANRRQAAAPIGSVSCVGIKWDSATRNHTLGTIHKGASCSPTSLTLPQLHDLYALARHQRVVKRQRGAATATPTTLVIE